MRKILFLFLLSLFVNVTKGAIFITNNTGCDVVFRLYSHDANNTAPCSYYSTRFTITPGGFQAWGNVTNLNMSPGWINSTTGVPSMLVLPSSGFDAADFWFDGFNDRVGFLTGCAVSDNQSGSGVTCGPATVTWTVIGANIFLDIS